MKRAALVLSALLVASTAHADPKPNRAPLAQVLKGDARVLYDSAKTLFAAGDYPSAFAKFQRAFELSGDPRLYWNMAACERKVKHNARVLRLIEAYLREGDAWLNDDERREASRAAAAVRAFVAAAKVTSEPADEVEVFVDDVKIATTPIDKPIWIDMGPHRVRFAKSGYKPVERTEEIPAGGDLTWAVDLEKIQDPTAPVAEVTPPPPSPLPPRHETPVTTSKGSIGPWILGGAGAAVAVGGGLALYFTTKRFSDLQSQCGTGCDPEAWKGDRTVQIIGDVLLATGGAMIAGAIVWWIATPSSSASTTRAFVTPTGIVF